jgi:hypothetical protein
MWALENIEDGLNINQHNFKGKTSAEVEILIKITNLKLKFRSTDQRNIPHNKIKCFLKMSPLVLFIQLSLSIHMLIIITKILFFY